MKFGEILKEVREESGLSINKLGRYSQVTPTYISRLENQHDKVPSEDMVNKLIIGLGKYKMEQNEKIDPVELLERFYSSTNLRKSKKEFDELALMLLTAYTNELNTAIGYISKLQDIIYENKIMLPKGKNKGEELDDPVFDLSWLLTQNRYELFYGREHLLNDKYNSSNEEKFYYNTLSDEDKAVLSALIKAYISTKYEKIKNPKDFFNEKFSYYYKKLLEKLDNAKELEKKRNNKED